MMRQIYPGRAAPIDAARGIVGGVERNRFAQVTPSGGD